MIGRPVMHVIGLSFVWLALGCTRHEDKGPSRDLDVRMKKADYRGGVVQFRIPASWITEESADGGAAYYEDKPNSPTLFLNVITLGNRNGVNSDTPAKLLESLPNAKEGTIERLGNGNAVLRYTQRRSEDGKPVVARYWLVTSIMPPDRARVATFSLVAPAAQADDPPFKEQTKVLDREICGCRFASNVGPLR